MMATEQKPSPVDWALGYAELGFPVLPCEPGIKKPYVEWARATTDEAKIRALWAENTKNGVEPEVGAILEDSGWMAMDLDVKNGGTGIADFDELMGEEDYHSSVMATTPTGGRHHFFKNTTGVIKDKIKWHGHIDYKSKGLIVLPSGRPDRQWLPDRYPKKDSAPFPPRKLFDAIKGNKPVPDKPLDARNLNFDATKVVPISSVAKKTRDLVQEYQDRLAELRTAVKGDGRNGLLNELALIAGRCGFNRFLDPQTMAHEMLQAMIDNGWTSKPDKSERDAQKTIESGYKAGYGFAEAEGPVATAVRKAAAMPSTRGELLTDDEFIASAPLPDYLVEGMVPAGGIFSWAAFTGTGKTSGLLLVGVHGAKGWPIAGHEFKPCSVVFYAGENPDNTSWQYRMLKHHLGLQDEPLPIHFVRGVFAMSEWLDKMAEEIETTGARLVIIDTHQAFFEGDDDNSNVQQKNQAQIIRELQERCPKGVTFLIACHPSGKKQPDDFEDIRPRGGGAFLNEIDGNMVHFKHHEDGYTTLRPDSSKFRGAPFKPICIVIEQRTHPDIVDSLGRPVSLPVASFRTLDEQEAYNQVGRDGAATLLGNALEDGVRLALAELTAPSEKPLSKYRAAGTIKKSRHVPNSTKIEDIEVVLQELERVGELVLYTNNRGTDCYEYRPPNGVQMGGPK